MTACLLAACLVTACLVTALTRPVSQRTAYLTRQVAVLALVRVAPVAALVVSVKQLLSFLAKFLESNWWVTRVTIGCEVVATAIR